jgi:cysteine desulfurase/selenocysteine lyase
MNQAQRSNQQTAITNQSALTDSVREDFPFFSHHPKVIFLDSATTTHKPKKVIEAIQRYYETNNASAGRATYPLANQTTNEIERIRGQVANHLGAVSAKEVFFTAGSTPSLQQLAAFLFETALIDGDQILLSESDHRSTVQPWKSEQQKYQQQNTHIALVPYRSTQLGSIDRKDVFAKINPRTKIIIATQVHSIFGTDSDIHKIADHLAELRLKTGQDILLVVDATQSVGHLRVSIADLGADYLVFSAHKTLAGQGLGVLFAKEDRQTHHPDFFPSLEQGSLNYASIISLGAALAYIEKLGIDRIHQRLADLTQYALHELRKIPHVQFTPGPHFWNCYDGNGIISFISTAMSTTELQFLLSEHMICVRSGNHCTIRELEFSDAIRVSMHVYNTKTDIDALCAVLRMV